MQRMPRSDLFFHLLFANSVQMDPDARSPTSTDDRRKFPLLRFPNAIVFPSIYLFRIWLQIGPDARNNAKQADDVVQDLGTSRKPAAFDNADGPIWTVGEKGFLHHPKNSKKWPRPTKAFFRASLT